MRGSLLLALVCIPAVLQYGCKHAEAPATTIDHKSAAPATMSTQASDWAKDVTLVIFTDKAYFDGPIGLERTGRGRGWCGGRPSKIAGKDYHTMFLVRHPDDSDDDALFLVTIPMEHEPTRLAVRVVSKIDWNVITEPETPIVMTDSNGRVIDRRSFGRGTYDFVIQWK